MDRAAAAAELTPPTRRDRRSNPGSYTEPLAYQIATEALSDVRKLEAIVGSPGIPALGTAGSGVLGAIGRLHEDVDTVRRDIKTLTASNDRQEQRLNEIADMLRRSAPPEPAKRKSNRSSLLAGVAAIIVALGGAGAGILQGMRPERESPPHVREHAVTP